MDNSMNKTVVGHCGCAHHRVNGFLVALAALAFLLGHLEVITMHQANIAWPILIMIVGLNKSLGRGMCKCCTHP